MSRSNKPVKTKNRSLRQLAFTIGVSIFILAVFVLTVLQMRSHEEDIISNCKAEEEMIIENLGYTLQSMYESGKEDVGVIDYLGTLMSSGSRFYVLTYGDTVLFAKDIATTNGLRGLKDRDKFWTEVNAEDVFIEKTIINTKNGEYELSVVRDLFSVKSSYNLQQHSYYIYLVVLVISFVLIATVETIVGVWNKTEKNLDGTKAELVRKNKDIEEMSYILENSDEEGKTNEVILDADGISDSGDVEFYNVYTMRRLLEKSTDPDLFPIHLIDISYNFNDKYISRQNIFDDMVNVQNVLKSNEVMGEIRKGQFLVCIYKIEEHEAEKRFAIINDICSEIKKDREYDISVNIIAREGDNALKVFDSYFE